MRAPAGQKFREVPMDLIDEPPRPVRETFDETALADLAESVRQVGVLEPILVEEADGRYTILAGHRRYLAARMSALAAVPAVIHAAGGHRGEAIKVHENLYREDLNPGEEAVYYSRLLEEACGGDTDRLSELVRQKRAYVEDRLLLLRGDPDVLAALKSRQVSFAVARELNKISDRGFRMSFLDAAIRGGASARLVAQWRAESVMLERALPADGATPSGPASVTPVTAEASGITCCVCEDREQPYNLELIYVHRGVCRKLLDRFLASLSGSEAGS